MKTLSHITLTTLGSSFIPIGTPALLVGTGFGDSTGNPNIPAPCASML